MKKGSLKKLNFHRACLCKIADSFIYVVSRMGVNGPTGTLSAGLPELLDRVHRLSGNVPAAVGFGGAIPSASRSAPPDSMLNQMSGVSAIVGYPAVTYVTRAAFDHRISITMGIRKLVEISYPLFCFASCKSLLDSLHCWS